MQTIIQPVDRKNLKTELTDDKFLRYTNNGKNEIYVVTHLDSPNVMIEIGRLRELTFRSAGGGTGKEIDIDEFDTASVPYNQLIVWNPYDQQIVGGYRFIKCNEVPINPDKKIELATSELFHFSTKFINEYYPFTIELGRSFVQPAYQPSLNSRKGIFSLDNIWDGLGALVYDNPDINYFFGKVTMYTSYNARARDMILYFLHRFFPDNENLVYPIIPVNITTPVEEFEHIFNEMSYKENYKKLLINIRRMFENIPPLFNAYMNLSPTMKTFGTALNHKFGDVEETCILVNIKDIYPIKKERHITSYIKHTLSSLQNIRKLRYRKHK